MFTVSVVPGAAVVISVIDENAVVVVVSASTVEIEVDVTISVLIAVTSTSGTVIKTVLVAWVVKLDCHCASVSTSVAQQGKQGREANRGVAQAQYSAAEHRAPNATLQLDKFASVQRPLAGRRVSLHRDPRGWTTAA